MSNASNPLTSRPHSLSPRALTAAGWIALNLDRFSYTDQSADIELVPPAGS